MGEVNNTGVSTRPSKVILVLLLLLVSIIVPQNTGSIENDVGNENSRTSDVMTIVDEIDSLTHELNETIIFEDTFDSSTIDDSLWSVSGDGISANDGTLLIERETQEDAITSQISFAGFFEIRFLIILNKIRWQDTFHGMNLSAVGSSHEGISTGFTMYNKFFVSNSHDGGTGFTYGSPHTTNTEYEFVIRKQAEYVYISINEKLEFTTTLFYPSADYRISLPGYYDDGDGDIAGTGTYTSSTIKWITVSQLQYEQPQADFSLDKPSVPVNATVSFTDLSSGPATSWLWNFGDGITSDIQHPTHIYQTPGMYTISMTVSNPEGNDEIVRSIPITVFDLLDEVWVDNNYTLDNDNDGHRWGYDAWNEIQHGIDAVAPYGTLYILPGRYYLPDNAIGRDSITIRRDGIKMMGSHFSEVIIDGEYKDSVLYVTDAEDVLIANITLTRGGKLPHNEGGGLQVAGGNVTVEDVIISDNRAVNGGGLRGELDSYLIVKDSVIENNYALNRVGGAVMNGIIENSSILNNAGGGVSSASYGVLRVNNSVLWGNGDDVVDGINTIIIVSYSVVEDCYEGVGNSCQLSDTNDINHTDNQSNDTTKSENVIAFIPAPFTTFVAFFPILGTLYSRNRWKSK